MIFKLLLLYFIFSMFQETVETVCPPLDGNSPVCFARLVESFLFKKCIFALRKKQKKVLHCFMALQVTKDTGVTFHKLLVLLQVR